MPMGRLDGVSLGLSRDVAALVSESCLGWVHACQPLHGGPRGDLDEAAVGGGGWQLQPLAGLVGP